MTQKAKTVAVVSSRLTRELIHWQGWFHYLRAVCAYVRDRRGALVLAPHTTPYRYLCRAAEMFHCETRPAGDLPLSAPFDDGDEPRQDRQSVAQADEVFALHVRPYGAVHQLLLKTLALAPNKRVYLAVIPQTSRRMQDELVAAGAVLWLPHAGELPSVTPAMKDALSDKGAGDVAKAGAAEDGADEERARARPQAPFLPAAPILWHCTRASAGPWPGETHEHYLDDLILGRPGASHLAGETLTRIVVSRRLMASSRAIRGGHRVVSFADLGWDELAARRQFRPHRTRWDFEPFGIGIRRAWLQKQGARPVEYGDEQLWQEMGDDRRPFFQRASSGRGRRTIDWTREAEWRHPGDLDLTQLPPAAGVIFVPDHRLRRRLATLCPWPVVTTETLLRAANGSPAC
ncbi:MAG: hypothetical protein AAGF97_19670 [Planctomycetota bacterium]